MSLEDKCENLFLQFNKCFVPSLYLMNLSLQSSHLFGLEKSNSAAELNFVVAIFLLFVRQFSDYFL